MAPVAGGCNHTFVTTLPPMLYCAAKFHIFAYKPSNISSIQCPICTISRPVSWFMNESGSITLKQCFRKSDVPKIWQRCSAPGPRPSPPSRSGAVPVYGHESQLWTCLGSWLAALCSAYCYVWGTGCPKIVKYFKTSVVDYYFPSGVWYVLLNVQCAVVQGRCGVWDQYLKFGLVLQTINRQSCTITEKAPTRVEGAY